MEKHRVTDHRKASCDSPAFVQAIMDSVAEPITVIGMDHRVQWVNHAASKLLPKETETVSQYCFSCFHGRQTPCNNWDYECPMLKVWQTQRPATVVHEHLGVKGESRLVEIVASPLRTRQGECVGVIETTHDVREQKRPREALERQIAALQYTLARVKALRRLVTVCAWCNRICDEDGSWKKMEAYRVEHSEARFTHGICPDCVSRF